MAEPYKVKITVASAQGTCAIGHKVGDSWIVEDKTPEGICLSAFNSMSPAFWVMRFGGEFPWYEDKEFAPVACPDAKNPVVFELRRLPK